MTDVNGPSQKKTIAILALGWTREIMTAFASIFLVAQIFTVTGYDFSSVGMFRMLYWTGLIFFNIVTAFLLKRFPAVWFLRISAIIAFVFISILAIFPDSLGQFYLLFGFVWGSISGLYWGPTSLIVVKSFNKEKSRAYVVASTVLALSTSILFPFTLGALIDLGSMTITTILIAAIAVLQFITTLLISGTKPETKSKLALGAYFNEMKQKKALRPTFLLAFIFFMYELARSMSLTKILLLVIVFGSNLYLGIWSSIFAGTGAVALLLFTRIRHKKTRSSLFYALSFIPLVASFVFFYEISILTIIIVHASFMIANIVISAEASVELNNIAKYFELQKYDVENNLFFKFVFYVGRVISSLMIAIVGITGGTELMLGIMISVMMLCLLAHAIGLQLWKRRYKPQL